MKQNPRPQPHPLCPHLAAAVLWMSKSTRSTRAGKRIRHVRAFGPAVDDLFAL